MARQSLPVSQSLGALLRNQRQRLDLTLREVEDRSGLYGEPIPFTTLGKVERGVVDPGMPRLNSLCKVYGISLQVAGDVLDLEKGRPGGADQRSAAVLLDDAVEAWKHGDVREAMAVVAGLRARTDMSVLDRQSTLLHFAILAGSLGRYQVSRDVIDDLLLEPPEPELRVRVLVQAAVCWHRRGCGDAALAFLGRAEQILDPNDYLQLAYITHEKASTLTTMEELDRAEGELARALAAYSKAGNLYGEGGAQGVGIRIAMCRKDYELAEKLAKNSLDHARRHKLDRLIYLRLIDYGKTLVELNRLPETHACLDEALALALLKQDHPAQFFVYHARWRARLAEGNSERAQLELAAAQYALRYVDEASPEAREVLQAIHPVVRAT